MNAAMVRCGQWVLLMVLWAVGGPAWAELHPLRVATLAFGTVAWEIDTLRHHGLDRAQGLKVDLVPVASGNAATVALQGGAADLIVTDWLWVARARGEGRRYQFLPHSRALGGLVVHADGEIDELAQLRGKRLGVAGGAADKSWLLLQHHARTQGLDLAREAQIEFAAPPALNELFRRGHLDAVLGYWHFNARLTAAGGRPLLGMDQVLAAQDVPEDLPLLGWVFDEALARERADALAAFARATAAAKERLAEDDAEWQRLRPLMKASSEAEFAALVAGYRAGLVSPLATVDEAAAARLWDLLTQLGGRDVHGAGNGDWPGEVFWTPPAPR